MSDANEFSDPSADALSFVEQSALGLRSQETFDRASDFARGYVVAALTLAAEEGEDEPMPSDLHPDTMEALVRDADAFAERHRDALDASMDHVLSRSRSGSSLDEIGGNDLWLTRNGHGAGFWDGDWPEPHATALDEGAKAMGACDLYRGDDGMWHAHPAPLPLPAP